MHKAPPHQPDKRVATLLTKTRSTLRFGVRTGPVGVKEVKRLLDLSLLGHVPPPESQLPHKTVNLRFQLVIVNIKLTIVWGS